MTPWCARLTIGRCCDEHVGAEMYQYCWSTRDRVYAYVTNSGTKQNWFLIQRHRSKSDILLSFGCLGVRPPTIPKKGNPPKVLCVSKQGLAISVDNQYSTVFQRVTRRTGLSRGHPSVTQIIHLCSGHYCKFFCWKGHGGLVPGESPGWFAFSVSEDNDMPKAQYYYFYRRRSLWRFYAWINLVNLVRLLKHSLVNSS